MGIATKYVKDKVKTGAKPITPGRDTDDADKMLFIEYEFYKNLEPRILMIHNQQEKQLKSILERITSYWNAICFDAHLDQPYTNDPSSEFLHPQYRAIYGEETILENKESKLLQVRISKNTKDTHLVRLAEKSCQIVNDTAFAVIDYAWEYTVRDKGILVRENGTLSQTWVNHSGTWKLLGESGGPIN